MNTVYLKRSDKTVDQIVKAAFPAYTGQQVQAKIADSIMFHNTMWDEGSRRTYVYVDLSTMQSVGVPQEQFGTKSDFHNHPHSIKEGFVCVVHAQCRAEHIEIHGPAANLTGLLPAPSNLTDDERVVLIATRSYKSTYGGIANYRFHEATRKTQITLDRWEAAKATLIEKKMLNKSGAITVEGKNAVGLDRL